MRLICPNCGAQYEVPDDVIPDEGRDVQCSNCGNTWFQHHPDNDPDLRDELIAQGYVEQTVAENLAEPAAVDIADAPPLADEDTEVAPEADADTAAPVQPTRRNLDPSIAEVLREEAEREARARAAEAAPLESQPDLGLTEPEDEDARRARQVRERMARIKGQPEDMVAEQPTAPNVPTPRPDEDLTASNTPTSRRDLLPDIDEINSSLRPASDKRPAEAADHALPGGTSDPDLAQIRASGSFRRGFIMALLLAAVMWAVYSMAPSIRTAVPALDGVLGNYVAVIDSARNALDDQVRQLLQSLEQQNDNG